MTATTIPSASIGQKFISVISTLIVVATITSLVLPGRQTPGIIAAFFQGLTSAVSATIGK